MAAMAETDIDSLLERYLRLLDDYVGLQANLSELHSGIYQNLAKANFTAPRGVRYGQDYYDGRMQAIRKVACLDQGSDCLILEVVLDDASSTPPEDEPVEEKTESEGLQDEKREDFEEAQQHPKLSRDPLRWFGILTPMPLRQAQKLAIESVEDIVPRLATVNAEMAAVELEIRRARKKRAKSEKLKQHQGEQATHAGQDQTVA